jgi:hypothetical protein
MRMLLATTSKVLALSLMFACAAHASNDPVVANSNTGANFNRYSYANNNPYKFTDPDGREVSYVYGSGVTEQSGRQYMISIVMAPTAHGEVRQMEGSSRPYTVVIDNNIEPGYDPNTLTVKLNPSLGFRIKSTGEVQSPKVNGAHELSHGAEHDRVGDVAFGEALKRPTNQDGTKGVSREEARATKVEQKVGKELGEPTRKNYKDSGERVKCNPKAASGC